jgi:hypothetical protein
MPESLSMVLSWLCTKLHSHLHGERPENHLRSAQVVHTGRVVSGLTSSSCAVGAADRADLTNAANSGGPARASCRSHLRTRSQVRLLPILSRSFLGFLL